MTLKLQSVLNLSFTTLLNASQCVSVEPTRIYKLNKLTVVKVTRSLSVINEVLTFIYEVKPGKVQRSIVFIATK